jgi:hypothetical protein
MIGRSSMGARASGHEFLQLRVRLWRRIGAPETHEDSAERRPRMFCELLNDSEDCLFRIEEDFADIGGSGELKWSLVAIGEHFSKKNQRVC